MTYHQLAYFHLATVVPAFFIATFMLIKRKGTPLHKMLGRVYMLLMLTTAVIVLFMPAHVGPKWLGHFGFIHLFSLLTFSSVFWAYIAIRRGNIKAHRGHMVGLYIGGLLIAGTFAFLPGRMLHQWLLSALDFMGQCKRPVVPCGATGLCRVMWSDRSVSDQLSIVQHGCDDVVAAGCRV